MISNEYENALELIIEENLCGTGPIENRHKIVSVFKMLIENGHDVNGNEIFYKLKSNGIETGHAAAIQDSYEIIKATMQTEFGYPEEFLRRRLLEDRPSAN